MKIPLLLFSLLTFSLFSNAQTRLKNGEKEHLPFTITPPEAEAEARDLWPEESITVDEARGFVITKIVRSKTEKLVGEHFKRKDGPTISDRTALKLKTKNRTALKLKTKISPNNGAPVLEKESLLSASRLFSQSGMSHEFSPETPRPEIASSTEFISGPEAEAIFDEVYGSDTGLSYLFEDDKLRVHMVSNSDFRCLQYSPIDSDESFEDDEVTPLSVETICFTKK